MRMMRGRLCTGAGYGGHDYKMSGLSKDGGSLATWYPTVASDYGLPPLFNLPNIRNYCLYLICFVLILTLREILVPIFRKRSINLLLPKFGLRKAWSSMLPRLFIRWVDVLEMFLPVLVWTPHSPDSTCSVSLHPHWGFAAARDIASHPALAHNLLIITLLLTFLLQPCTSYNLAK